jgi:hypothetical protein
MTAVSTPRTDPVPAVVAESEITANLRQHAEAARGAFASNTERALRADVVIFTGWCTREDRQALPASAEIVAAFIDAMAASKAPATVPRYVSASPPSTAPPRWRTRARPRSSSWR